MRRARADFPAGDDAELVRVYFDSLVGGAVCHIQHPVWPQMDVVRSAQPPDGSALFPCIGVDDRNGAVAFVGGVDPRGGQEIRDGAEGEEKGERSRDRKSTRLNSSHSQISYAVFCLKKKKKKHDKSIDEICDVDRCA